MPSRIDLCGGGGIERNTERNKWRLAFSTVVANRDEYPPSYVMMQASATLYNAQSSSVETGR